MRCFSRPDASADSGWILGAYNHLDGLEDFFAVTGVRYMLLVCSANVIYPQQKNIL
jgi:hypothetical protein